MIFRFPPRYSFVSQLIPFRNFICSKAHPIVAVSLIVRELLPRGLLAPFCRTETKARAGDRRR
ncbi:hypothetical protein KQQSB11_370064 [Klebsiella quasipneumoniae subsp. quasipneumoniae]|nr:hypothetical protein KQQSB11_370064 [Klebsiella quasipneumoniae subsp. quasipneumoniae]